MASTYDRHIFRQLEDVIKKCDNLSQKMEDMKKKHQEEIYEIEAKHNKKVKELENRIEELENENHELKEKNKTLENDNIRMKAILGKNSSNSSIPSSKDENKPKKEKKNLREKTNKKSGGQKGHKGATLTKNDIEELLKQENVKKETILHGNPTSKNYKVKYKIGIKTIITVEEHRFYYDDIKKLEIPKEFNSEVQYNEEFKTLCSIMSIEEVISLERIEQFVGILTNGLIKVSQGSIVNWIKELSKKCRKTIKQMKIAPKNSSIIYTDLTETKDAKGKRYIRNYSVPHLTIYIPSKDKKIVRVNRHRILKNYTGYIVHDHDTGLYQYGLKEKHVECNVHLRRYLKNNTELTKHEWSKKLDELLLEIKAEKEKLEMLGIEKFRVEKMEEYSKRYDEIIRVGKIEHKKDKKVQNSKYLKDEEKPLLNRLEKYKNNHLIFAYDFAVPFDNNLSERDLRPAKTKLKISGCHRSYRGLKDYCNIRSIISSCKKQGINFYKELVNISKGNHTTLVM